MHSSAFMVVFQAGRFIILIKNHLKNAQATRTGARSVFVGSRICGVPAAESFEYHTPFMHTVSYTTYAAFAIPVAGSV